MKTNININMAGSMTRLVRLSLLIALTLYGAAFSAQAQVLSARTISSAGASIETVTSVPVRAVLPVTSLRTGTFSSDDLVGLDEQWWKSLVAYNTAVLRVPDEDIRVQSMQNIIYFTTQYPTKVNFNAAVPGLMKIYRNDRNENMRIMALAALSGIGNYKSMLKLNHRVQSEKSPRVKQLTRFVIADYVQRTGAIGF